MRIDVRDGHLGDPTVVVSSWLDAIPAMVIENLTETIKHEEGSRIARLVKVLRETAKTDEKLTNIIGNFSLL